MQARRLARASLNYRPDIDGLRAVAVLAVLVFHAFPEALPGGFVGVDIFFVISGFLITGIILNDLQNSAFTFANFYARRIRRIFPSLIPTLTATLLLGWFLLLPDEFRQLSKHVAAGAAFVSNIVLWREAGYFDTGAQSKPLLHLWSLGVEEQYYIVWPLLLAFLWRSCGDARPASGPAEVATANRWWRPRSVLPGICLLALVSFALNVAMVRVKPVAAFYLPFTRVWELLIGSALARLDLARSISLRSVASNALSALGAALIGFSVLVITEDNFPGWWALPPTVGTALLITAGPDAFINRRVLALGWLVTIGLISYPLYLWHWPLVTYFRLVAKSDLVLTDLQSAAARILIVGICILLAWATWRFWETPLRHPAPARRFSRTTALAAAMATLAVFGAASMTGAVTPRLNQPLVMNLVRAAGDWDYLPNDNQVKSVFAVNEIPSGSDRIALFVGDSHMEQYWPRAKAVLRANPALASAVFATYPGCPPLPNLGRTQAEYHCPEFYDYWITKATSSRVRTVAIGAYWESYFLSSFLTETLKFNPSQLLNAQGNSATAADFDASWRSFEASLRGLVKSGRRVVILSSTPASPAFDPHRVFHRFRGTEIALLQPVNRLEFDRFLAPVEGRLTELANRVGASVIRPADYFCSGGLCPAVDERGLPMYKDGNHLRASSVIEKATFVDELLQP